MVLAAGFSAFLLHAILPNATNAHNQIILLDNFIGRSLNPSC